MPHSYANNLLHVVFSTRQRKPTIPATSLAQLWAVLAGIGQNHHLTVIKIGGMADHVHILFALPADVALAHAVQVLKANSSRWMRQRVQEFAWYGAFSVSASVAGAVKRYIGEPGRAPQEAFVRRRVPGAIEEIGRAVRSEIRLWMICRAYGTPGVNRLLPQHCRAGLTYDGPTALAAAGACVVSYTERGSRIRLISARLATGNERRQYEEAE